MAEQYGAIFIFLGILFLTSGSIYYLTLRRQRNKYPKEAYATISSCYQYEEKAEDSERIYITRIYYALTLNFMAEGKSIQVKRDIGIHKRNIRSKDPNLYTVGEKLKVYYNPKKPKDIYVELNNSNKVSSVLAYLFICIGLFSLLIGSYLTFGNISD
jgi:hypothetical protein